MKKFLTIFGLAMLLSVANVFAQDCDYSGTTGELEWCLKDGTLTISGEGEMPDYGYGESPWWEYRETIETVVIETGVTSVGNNAFSYCTYLISTTIPNGVTKIGKAAFNVCSVMSSITIPDSVTSIGDGAFGDCNSLTSITIPNGRVYKIQE